MTSILSLIFPFFDQVILFFNAIWDFIATGIYDLLKEVFIFLGKVAIYAWLQGQLFLLEVSLKLAKELTQSLGIAEFVNSGYRQLPGEVEEIIGFFGVPQAINIMFSGLATRFCMKFIPFIGR